MSLSFVPELLDLIKEYWEHPANSTSMSRRTENLYRIHGTDTSFLLKHPAPNSLVIESSASKTPAKGHTTPSNKEGRKLEVLGRRMYSMTTFVLRAINYLITMGAYQKELWSRILPALQIAPDDIRQLCLNTHAEALMVSKHLRLGSALQGSPDSRIVVPSRSIAPHQPSGAFGCHKSAQGLPPSGARQSNTVGDRQ